MLVSGILIVDLSNSIIVFIFIFFISASIYKILKNKLVLLGKKKTKYNIYLLKNLGEFFNGIKQIKILNLEKILEFEFSRIIKSLLKIDLTMGYIVPLPRIILEVVGVSGILLVIVLFLNDSGNFNEILPSITFIALATRRMIPAFASINNNLNNVLSNSVSAEIINNDMKLKIEKKKKSKEIKNFKNLKIKNLNFSFKNKKIFNNINLNLKKNDMVGIIGSSGSGKTTLADLILGLLKPQNGKIIFNDKFDLNNYQFSRDFFGYVPQDAFLLNETIRNNLTMGIKKNINKKKIDNVLGITELKNLISNLPDGIDTIIGDRGSKISGGQRQRIGIARSLLQDPQFLILDESTSSLDEKTEKKVLNRILNLNNKTIILITHRKNILKSCNKIFSLTNKKLRQIR
jgi:ABC-type multidrug transport system fused ATPase/permease subunit